MPAFELGAYQSPHQSCVRSGEELGVTVWHPISRIATTTSQCSRYGPLLPEEARNPPVHGVRRRGALAGHAPDFAPTASVQHRPLQSSEPRLPPRPDLNTARRRFGKTHCVESCHCGPEGSFDLRSVRGTRAFDTYCSSWAARPPAFELGALSFTRAPQRGVRRHFNRLAVGPHLRDVVPTDSVRCACGDAAPYFTLRDRP